MIRISRVFAIFLAVLSAACLSQSSPPSSAPANLSAVPGDGLTVLSWDMQPGLTYWAFYKAGSAVSTADYDRIVTGVVSPVVIPGLRNGTQYAFIVNATNGDSKAGPSTPVVTATPRLLGPSIPWTVGTPLSSNALRGIAIGNSHFMAVGDAATIFTAPYSYSATGGVTAWSQTTTLPIGPATDLVSVLYDGAQFVALGADGTIITSNDTVTWIARSGIAGAPAMNGLAFGAGPTYVAVGAGGAIYRNTGGITTGTWSAQTSGTGLDLYGVSYLNGVFVAVGAGGALLTSQDGVSWTVRSTGTNNTLRDAAFGAGVYVAVGDAGTIISSPDAATWTPQSIPTTQSFYGICFGPDAQFIAVGTVGTLAYSSTGADGSWAIANAGSVDLYSIVPGGVYIAVGDAGANASGK